MSTKTIASTESISAEDIDEMAKAIREDMLKANDGIDADIPTLPHLTKAVQMTISGLLDGWVKSPVEFAEENEREIEDWIKYYERQSRRKEVSSV